MKTRTKNSVMFGLVFLFVFGLASMSFADSAIKGFSLKVGGGSGSWNGSDLNNFFLDLNLMMTNTAGLVTGGDVIGRFDELNYGPDFEGEFILELPNNFAVGIGVGYMVRKGDSTSDISIFSTTNSIAVETRFTAIPIALNGYYKLPLGAKTKVYLKAGVGYYIGKAKYSVRQEQSILGLPPVWDEEEGDASSSAFGFHGGLGFELSLSETVALFFETTGRYANLKNWEGHNRYRDFLGSSGSETVDWYYAEEYDDTTRQWYRTIQILEEEPTNSGLRNVRKAEINYSGVVFRLGFKITFGKK